MFGAWGAQTPPPAVHQPSGCSVRERPPVGTRGAMLGTLQPRVSERRAGAALGSQGGRLPTCSQVRAGPEWLRAPLVRVSLFRLWLLSPGVAELWPVPYAIGCLERPLLTGGCGHSPGWGLCLGPHRPSPRPPRSPR